jgi:hypothetical protein
LESKEGEREEILAATVAWVIEENQPFNAAEKPSCRRMMSAVDNWCNEFHARSIRDEIMKLGRSVGRL